jgi:hypothetical protein
MLCKENLIVMDDEELLIEGSGSVCLFVFSLVLIICSCGYFFLLGIEGGESILLM